MMYSVRGYLTNQKTRTSRPKDIAVTGVANYSRLQVATTIVWYKVNDASILIPAQHASAICRSGRSNSKSLR